MIGMVIYAPEGAYGFIQLGKPISGNDRDDLINQASDLCSKIKLSGDGVFVITAEDLKDWKQQMDLLTIEEL